MSLSVSPSLGCSARSSRFVTVDPTWPILVTADFNNVLRPLAVDTGLWICRRFDDYDQVALCVAHKEIVACTHLPQLLDESLVVAHREMTPR
jgi:hypothetical protein